MSRLDWENCRKGCIPVTQGDEFAKGKDTSEIFTRLYKYHETITVIDGKFMPKFSFDKPGKIGDDFDPKKPGWKYPWDPLKEVLIGNVEYHRGFDLPGALVSFVNRGRTKEYHGCRDFWLLNRKDVCSSDTRAILKEQDEELNEIVRNLEDRDIKVHRPIRYPVRCNEEKAWNLMAVRDALLVIGNHFFPSRWKRTNSIPAYMMLWAVLNDIEERGGIVHRKEPVNLKDESLVNMGAVPKYMRKCLPKRRFPSRSCKFAESEDIADYDFFYSVLSNKEPIFEAADFNPIGNDIFTQISHRTNYAGIQYLSKTVGKNYRFHIVPTLNATGHFDETLSPIKDKLLVYSANDLPEKWLPKYFKDWKKIVMDPYLGAGDADHLIIDDKNLILDPKFEDMIRQLKEHGVNVIEVKQDALERRMSMAHCNSIGLVRGRG